MKHENPGSDFSPLGILILVALVIVLALQAVGAYQYHQTRNIESLAVASMLAPVGVLLSVSGVIIGYKIRKKLGKKALGSTVMCLGISEVIFLGWALLN